MTDQHRIQGAGDQIQLGGHGLWYELCPTRLAQEAAVMSFRFPSFTLLKEKDGTVGWERLIHSPSGARYRVYVRYPSDFPHQRPQVFIVEPKIRGPHMNSDASLDLESPYEGTLEPSQVTAAYSLIRTMRWISCFEAKQRVI